VCRACGLVQKPVTPAWTAEAEAIYAAYTIYHNAGGSEQTVFAGGAGFPASRSARVVREVRARVPLPAAGRMLDLGCGNGAMLRAFGGEFPGWTLAGNDLSEQHRAAVESIPGVERFHAGTPADVPGAFDVITLAHVLEHVPNPAQYLRAAAAKLTPGGLLLIEVPSHRHNPFDLTVTDHCSHFTLETLRAVARSAGLEVVVEADDIIPRELTLVARPTIIPQPGRPADVGAAIATASRHVRWLTGLAEQARDLAAAGFGAFGTSIGAAWLLGTAGDGVRFFLDEDPAKVGQTWDGRPILRPADAPAGVPVLIGLPDALAADIHTRLGRLIGGERLHIPRAA
jgi:SAM-dependent methyltransferase